MDTPATTPAVSAVSAVSTPAGTVTVGEQSPRERVGEWTGGPEWGLFADWCAATGQVALPATWPVIAAFLAEVPCRPAVAARRLRAIRRAHQHARQQSPARLVLPRPVVPVTAWRTGPTTPTNPDNPAGLDQPGEGWWLALPDALAALPVTGWPDGLRARRDGVVLVAVGYLGWTRARTAALATGQVRLTPSSPTRVTLDDTPVPTTSPPARCPACAITRWCRALAAWQHEWADAAWYALQDQLWQPANPDRHDCAIAVPPGWTHAQTLVPQIGPRLGPKAALPPRLTPIRPEAITAILTARRHPTATPQTTPPAGPGQHPDPTPQESTPRPHPDVDDVDVDGVSPTEQEFDDLFERLDARITQLDTATRALLDAAQ